MLTDYFTVDAALLRELGERLVGQPHVALVELIKNGYDADASHVDVSYGDDTITVLDDGHGLTAKDFHDYWLRIGSTHKEMQRYSRRLGRSLTGQKGVGRLAVQFLGRTLDLTTVASEDGTGLRAIINWDEALKQRDLTRVSVHYETIPTAGLAFANGSDHGVRLTIGKVKKTVFDDLAPHKLAARLWALQPPAGVSRAERAFTVRVLDAHGRPTTSFDDAMQAHLSQWHAVIRGTLRAAIPGGQSRWQFVVEFEDTQRFQYSADIESSWIHEADFEVRVFSPHGRLKAGIRVGEFRDYLKDYGGVRIFDAGFQLPFYGETENDWLGVELDHSHRLADSRYLPESLQVARGMTFLPTTSRLLGIVEVDTGSEAKWIADHQVHKGVSNEPPLSIAITRDRLIQNRAYFQLRDGVRAAIDYYAMREASRELTKKSIEAARAPISSARDAVVAMQARIEAVRQRLPAGAAKEIQDGLSDILEATRRADEARQAEAAVLGTLATAGLLTLAQQHELGKHLVLLEEIISSARAETATVSSVGWIDQLEAWRTRVYRTHRLFSAYLEPGNRTERRRLPVRATLVEIVEAVAPLMRGIPVDLNQLSAGPLLPAASLAEWTAIFQNVLLNAANSIVLSGERGGIRLSYIEARRQRFLRVEDAGVGIDVEQADRYFRPFERAQPAPATDSALGGSGLGLTIVRIVGDRIGCRSSFVQPSAGYSAAFQLAWDE
jgi:signal transduction histidine kinase